MTLDEFNNINEEEYYYFDDNYLDKANNLKSFAKSNPLLTKILLTGSVITGATIISPKIRKVTIPTVKFICKQQLKLLAGIGVLSIATCVSSQSDDLNDTVL